MLALSSQTGLHGAILRRLTLPYMVSSTRLELMDSLRRRMWMERTSCWLLDVLIADRHRALRWLRALEASVAMSVADAELRAWLASPRRRWPTVAHVGHADWAGLARLGSCRYSLAVRLGASGLIVGALALTGDDNRASATVVCLVALVGWTAMIVQARAGSTTGRKATSGTCL